MTSNLYVGCFVASLRVRYTILADSSIKNRHSLVRRQGLSLIELLVVISIITMLSVLVISVVPSVRESSRQTACAGNLRQIMASQLSYSHDWNGWMQPMFTTQGGNYYPALYWTTLMDFLVQDHGLNRESFFCPSTAHHDRSNKMFGAAIWDYYGTYTATDYTYIANPMLGPGESQWSNFSAVPRRIFDRPAETVVIADLVLTADSGYLPPGNYFSNHVRTLERSHAWQTDRQQLRGANQGSLDGHVSFKLGLAFPDELDARMGPNFNATVTHSWQYNWGFFF